MGSEQSGFLIRVNKVTLIRLLTAAWVSVRDVALALVIFVILIPPLDTLRLAKCVSIDTGDRY